MRHCDRKKQLGRGRDHRRSMLRNLATSLVLNEKIKTTEIKAKALRSKIDRVMAIAKKKDAMNAIRMLQPHVFSEAASRKIMTTLKERYAGRNSGFTRISPVKFRKGDNAKIVQIELIK